VKTCTSYLVSRCCDVESSAFQTFFLAYHFHDTKHVSLPLGTANINANCQDTDFQEVSRNNNAVETSNFAVATFLI